MGKFKQLIIDYQDYIDTLSVPELREEISDICEKWQGGEYSPSIAQFYYTTATNALENKQDTDEENFDRAMSILC